MIELAQPLFLLLLPVALLAHRFLPPAPATGAALALPDGVLRDLPTGGEAGWRRAGWLLPAAIWVLLVVALAGPRQVLPVPALPVSGRDLAVALDLSGSMVREDFELDGAPVTRLDAVKSVGSAFVRGRVGDRVALIVFGSEAYYAAPFSFDVGSVAARLEEATIGISGRATNISDALGLAIRRLESSEAASRVVILLSDGVNNAGATNPRGVAEYAAGKGIRIHTIALGPRDVEGADDGERGVVDAATLAAIAELSGGETFRVRTTDDLRQVAEALDRLEATAAEGLAAEVYREFWIWPAMAAGALSLAVAWRRAA